MRHDQVTHADLHRLATWLSVEEPQLRPVLDRAVNTVLAVSKAEFWQQASRGERSVETPFTYAVRGRELVSGVIDLMFRGQSAWQIVDYKTDVNPANLAASYAEQLKMYERALARVGIADSSSQVHPIRVQQVEG